MPSMKPARLLCLRELGIWLRLDLAATADFCGRSPARRLAVFLDSLCDCRMYVR